MPGNNLPVVIWSAVEVNIGICCACGPTLKSLIKTIVPYLLSINLSGLSRDTRHTTNSTGTFYLENIAPKTSCVSKIYAKIDQESAIQIPEVGKIRVTKVVEQDIEFNDERRLITCM
jgi:hypothetical protein